MAQPATTAPGYHQYQPVDATVAIQFAAPAQEKLLTEVMTGFGAVPRRGAEVGGLLLGRMERGAIWVDDVVNVPCEHRRGPSFLLSERDEELLEEAYRSAAGGGNGPKPVGMFRSNTRDQDTITGEDRLIFEKYFPAPGGVFFVVRPFATKPPVGSFLLYRDGSLPDSVPDSFELHRTEPEMGLSRRRTISESRQPRQSAPPSVEVAPPAAEQVVPAPPQLEEDQDHTSTLADTETRRRRTWLWVPLSFIFLVLGVLLGFQAALTFYPKATSVDAGALALGLSAVRRGENLHIRWNREALAVRAAERGKLEIEDGKYRKSVDLDANALQNGSVIYPPLSETVNFRFEITVRGGTQVIESLAWSKLKSE